MKKVALLLLLHLVIAGACAAQSYREVGSVPASAGIVGINSAGAMVVTPLAYDQTGTAVPNYHLTGGGGSYSSGVLTVTISGAGAFTSSTTYQCFAATNQATPANIKPLSITYTSGTVFVIRSSDTTETSSLRWLCFGN